MSLARIAPPSIASTPPRYLSPAYGHAAPCAAQCLPFAERPRQDGSLRLRAPQPRHPSRRLSSRCAPNHLHLAPSLPAASRAAPRPYGASRVGQPNPLRCHTRRAGRLCRRRELPVPRPHSGQRHRQPAPPQARRPLQPQDQLLRRWPAGRLRRRPAPLPPRPRLPGPRHQPRLR